MGIVQTPRSMIKFGHIDGGHQDKLSWTFALKGVIGNGSEGEGTDINAKGLAILS